MKTVPHVVPDPERPRAVSRRGLLGAGAALVTSAAGSMWSGVASAAPGKPVGPGGPPTPGGQVDPGLTVPVDRAYRYLDTVMDAYGSGDSPRLLQSYNNESGLMTTAFVYDNALAINAYLARPTPANVARARVIGDAFLWVQANDERFSDGRVRQAYATGPMLFYGGGPFFPGLAREDGRAAFLWPFGFGGSAVGDVAWTAISLVQLYAHTRTKKYLDGAVAAAEWIVGNNVSPYAYGGYLGGAQADGVTYQRWCATEHNIDVYALCAMLHKLTKDKAWAARGAVAKDFVNRMWNPKAGHYWTGTVGGLPEEDPNLINEKNVPEDVNTWSYLALKENKTARAIDWNVRHLSNTDTADAENSELPAGVRVSGVTFGDQSKLLTGPVPNGTGDNDRSAVWLEGNGHMAIALLERGRPADRAKALGYLQQTVVAQTSLGAGQTVGLTADPNGGRLSDPGAGGTWTGTVLPAAGGVVAASSAFDTGFGYGYFQRQHVGATAWFLMAAQGFNPLRLAP